MIALVLSLGCFIELAAEPPFNEWGDGWEMVDTIGRRLSPSLLFLPYNSVATPYYYRGNLETGAFESIELEIYSAVSTKIEIAIYDHEGRIYRANRSLPGDAVTNLRLGPGDFRSDPAETYLSRKPDGESFAGVVRLFDIGTADALIPRSNRFVVHNIKLNHPPLPVYEGLLRVRKEFRLSSSWEVRGDIVVEPGGTLLIEGSTLRLTGRILVFGGQVRLERGELQFSGSNRGRAGIELSRDALFQSRDSRVSATVPLRIQASGNSSLRILDSEFLGDPHISLREGSRLFVSSSLNIGNIYSDLSSDVSIEDSRGMELWLPVGENSTGVWSLPASGRIEEWDGDELFPFRLSSCREVGWNLRIIPGAGGLLHEAELHGIELIVEGAREADFSGLQLGKPPPGGTLAPEFYQLKFSSRVRFGEWNVTVLDGATGVVRNSNITRAVAEGRGSNLSIVNCESSGPGSEITSALGAVCVITDSRLDSPLTVLPGGDLRLVNSSNSGPIRVANGARLRILQSYLLEPPEQEKGGFIVGTAEALPEAPMIENRSQIPIPVMTRADVGGFGTFFPKVSGLEFLEDSIVPYFELNLLNRIFVRFPEFEYVLVRRRWPRFSSLSLGVEALFERERYLVQEDGRILPIQESPLSYETSFAGRVRLVGPLWGSAEIAADPSGRSYAGFRTYSRLEALRRLPENDLEVSLFAGMEQGSGNYWTSYYPAADQLKRGVSPLFFDYGVSLEALFDERWLFTALGRVQDFSLAKLQRDGTTRSLEWEIVLALAYRFR